MVHMENRCDMELLKMAMLRHESTFREQVHELHRLYRVQKQLMRGLSSRPSELGCRRPRRALDLRLPTHDEYIVIAPPPAEDGLELTLAVGSGARASRRKRRVEASNCLGLNCSGGSLTTSSSSTDAASGSPRHRAVSTFRTEERTTIMKQPQLSPWLVQCLSLKMV